GRAARELMRAAPARVLGLRSWLFELANLEADAALTRGAAVTANLARDPEVKATVRRFVEEGTPPWVGRWPPRTPALPSASSRARTASASSPCATPPARTR